MQKIADAKLQSVSFLTEQIVVPFEWTRVKSSNTRADGGNIFCDSKKNLLAPVAIERFLNTWILNFAIVDFISPRRFQIISPPIGSIRFVSWSIPFGCAIQNVDPTSDGWGNEPYVSQLPPAFRPGPGTKTVGHCGFDISWPRKQRDLIPRTD